MTDEEFYERQRQINASWLPITSEQMATYARGMTQVTPEELEKWNTVIGPQLMQDPFLIKLAEMEQRAQTATEHRFTKWCRGARRWE